MAIYHYEAIREPSESVQGEIEADNPIAASTALLNRGYHVLRLDSIDDTRNRRTLLGFRRIRRREVTTFTRDLVVLLKAGLTLSTALHTLRTHLAQHHWIYLTTNLRSRLEDGAPFSQALAAHPDVFDSVYVNLVRAGEESGKLPDALDRLARLYEQRDEIQSRVTLAFIYPAVLLLLGALTVFVMMVFVVPVFTGVFQQTGQTLPWPTQVLVGTSAIVGKLWWLFPLAVIGILAGGNQLVQNAAFRKSAGRALVTLPLIKTLVRNISVGSFSRTLGSLLDGGVHIVSALRTTAKVVGNPVYQAAIEDLAERAHGGELLSKALTEHGVFPPALASIAAVGEQSGALADTLLKYAEDTERQLDREVRTLMTLIEPLMIVLLGCVIGFIVVAMLLPIFNLGESLDM